MDRLHQTLSQLRMQTKAERKPITVFREFLSHLDRLTSAPHPPRRKASVRKGKRAKG